MRTRTLTTAGLAAAGLLALTACSTTAADTTPASGAPAATTAAVADSSAPSSDLSQAFGQVYTWPDGVKVTVTGASRFTDYNADYGEAADPGDFRVKISITNGSAASLDLTNLSTIIDGATNGGEAMLAAFTNGSAPLEGRVAPGVTVVKTDDNNLGTEYGAKIVVTVQRMSPDGSDVMDFPEFIGSITG